MTGRVEINQQSILPRRMVQFGSMISCYFKCISWNLFPDPISRAPLVAPLYIHRHTTRCLIFTQSLEPIWKLWTKEICFRSLKVLKSINKLLDHGERFDTTVWFFINSNVRSNLPAKPNNKASLAASYYPPLYYTTCFPFKNVFESHV